MGDFDGQEEEIENVIMEEQIEVPLKKTKSGRVRKPLSEEAKTKMLENLKAGREKKAKKRAEAKAQPITKKVDQEKEMEQEPVSQQDVVSPPKVIPDGTSKKTTPKDVPDVTQNEKPKIKRKKQKIIVQVDSSSSSDEDAIIIKTRGKRKPKKQVNSQDNELIQKPTMTRSNNVQDDYYNDNEIERKKIMNDHYNKMALNMLNRKI